jgi:hypothetical protein
MNQGAYSEGGNYYELPPNNLKVLAGISPFNSTEMEVFKIIN